MERMERVDGAIGLAKDVKNIIRGPGMVARTYTHMYKSRRHMQTWRIDHMKKMPSNAWVFIMTYDDEDRELPYYGTIVDILEVDFFLFHLCAIRSEVV